MKKFTIILISILLTPLSNNISGCGFSLMPEEYRVYLFNQSALNRNELMPLFYSSEYFYNSNYSWYSNDNTGEQDYYSKTEQTNAEEWKEHTKYKGSVNDIVSGIYREDVNGLITHPDSILNKLPFLKHIFRNYKKEYEYLIFAKKCELINENTDPWGLLPDNNKYIEALEKTGKAALSNPSNKFLQLRYAYQLIKINFYYPGVDESVSHLYDAYIKPSPVNSWLKSSAKFYVYQTTFQNSEEFQYFLSLSFNETIDKKFRCVQLFDRKNYLKTMALAKNNNEKANIYVMYELQNPARSLNNLKKIAELDPKNQYLPFLIAREINKLEDWLLTPELTSFAPSIIEYGNDPISKLIDIRSLSNKIYLNNLYSFITGLIKKSSGEQVPEYHVLASNVCILLKQKQTGYKHLVIAEATSHVPELKYQVLFNKIAIIFDGKTLLNDTIKNQILSFAKFSNEHSELLTRQKTTLTQLYLFIGRRLMKAGDVANGILFCSKTSRPLGTISYWKTKTYLELLLENAGPLDFDEILDLIDKPNKTEFENFLFDRAVSAQEGYYNNVDTAKVNKNKILDYKSMYYVQHDLLDSALSCVNKITPNYWNQYPYTLFKCFPFISGNSTDYQSNNDFCPYTKRKFLQRMVDVKYLADNKIGDVSKHYFVLANGYFNMSYHGNYWIMNMPYKLSNEVEDNYYSISEKNKLFLENYYGCKRAEYYFLKAFENATDTAFAAICIHKAGLCNQNLQALNWRLNSTFDDKEYKWSRELKITPDKYRSLFVNRFKDKELYMDYVSNCYHYKHTNSYYY